MVLVLSQGLGPNRPCHPSHQVLQFCSGFALHWDQGCMLHHANGPPPPPSPREPPRWGDGDVVAYHTARGDHPAAIAFAERLLRTPSASAALRAEMQGSLPTGPSRDRGGGAVLSLGKHGGRVLPPPSRRAFGRRPACFIQRHLRPLHRIPLPPEGSAGGYLTCASPQASGLQAVDRGSPPHGPCPRPSCTWSTQCGSHRQGSRAPDVLHTTVMAPRERPVQTKTNKTPLPSVNRPTARTNSSRLTPCRVPLVTQGVGFPPPKQQHCEPDQQSATTLLSKGARRHKPPPKQSPRYFIRLENWDP